MKTVDEKEDEKDIKKQYQKYRYHNIAMKRNKD